MRFGERRRISIEEDKQAVGRVFKEVMNRGFRPARRECERSRTCTAPGLHMTAEDVIAEGDQVAVRWTATGTHTGDLMGTASGGAEGQFRGHLVVPHKGRSDGRRVDASQEFLGVHADRRPHRRRGAVICPAPVLSLRAARDR